MKMRLTCPSKTFLLGEYAVLDSGEALLFNTAPRFEMLVDMHGHGHVQGIDPGSPAGLWLRQNKLPVQKLDIVFNDPHAGRGGFGASSAQFLMVHILTQILKSPEKDEDFAIQSIHRAFRQLTSEDGKTAPSGADLVAQYYGGLCEVGLADFNQQRWKWPFLEYDLYIVPTGKKVSTHKHLNDLNDFSTDELTWIYNQAMDAFGTGEEETFFAAVNDYQSELVEMGLVAPHTQELIAGLWSLPFVQAAKGCGALGNDAVMVVVREESTEEFKKYLNKLNLKVLADLSNVSQGFHIETDVDVNLKLAPEEGGPLL